MRFHNRVDAGQKLAEVLASVLKPPCVVAGIPRGGVAIALPIVDRFRLPLTVVYARKLTARVAPEFAFGAIDEDGQTIVDPRSAAMLGLSPQDVERAKERVAKEIRRRMTTYGVPALAHYLPDKAVVLVDDGLATGLTMRAALEYARRHGAREIIVAVPCASEPAATEFERAADRFVSLVVDADFRAVGQYYDDFSPVTDDEVIAMLTASREPAAPTPAAQSGSIAHGPSQVEATMDTSLPLSSEEREALRESLQAYLTELRRELAATEKYLLQKALGQRQEVLERILSRLAA